MISYKGFFVQAAIAAVITIAVYLLYWNQNISFTHHSDITVEVDPYQRRKRDTCFNTGAISYLQKLQLKRALYEQSLFKGNSKGSDDERDEDGTSGSSGSGGRLGRRSGGGGGGGGGVQFKKDGYKGMFVNNKRLASFYTMNFGGVNMMIPPGGQAQAQARGKSKSPKSSKTPRKTPLSSTRGENGVPTAGSGAREEAFYYRILKGGNEYIRYLIYRYAYYLGDSFEYKANTCLLHECTDNNVHMMSPIELRSAYFSYHKYKRFPFTYVRNPMKRFISAYSEVEQIWSSDDRRKPPSDLFPVIARVGSKERFEDFVNSLLSYFGKEDLLDLDDHERDKYIDDTGREDAPMRALFDISSEYTDMFYMAPMIGQFCC